MSREVVARGGGTHEWAVVAYELDEHNPRRWNYKQLITWFRRADEAAYLVRDSAVAVDVMIMVRRAPFILRAPIFELPWRTDNE